MPEVQRSLMLAFGLVAHAGMRPVEMVSGMPREIKGLEDYINGMQWEKLYIPDHITFFESSKLESVQFTPFRFIPITVIYC